MASNANAALSVASSTTVRTTTHRRPAPVSPKRSIWWTLAAARQKSAKPRHRSRVCSKFDRCPTMSCPSTSTWTSAPSCSRRPSRRKRHRAVVCWKWKAPVLRCPRPLTSRSAKSPIRQTCVTSKWPIRPCRRSMRAHRWCRTHPRTWWHLIGRQSRCDVRIWDTIEFWARPTICRRNCCWRECGLRFGREWFGLISAFDFILQPWSRTGGRLVGAWRLFVRVHDWCSAV